MRPLLALFAVVTPAFNVMRLVLALFAVLTPAFVAQGQAISGRVVTADSARGVGGVIVLLRDSTNAEAGRTISRADGSFTVGAPREGTYLVRTLRIGFKPGEHGPYRLNGAEAIRALLPLIDVPVSLAGITVSAQNDCRSRDEGGSAALALWEEARKALVATVLTRTDIRPMVTLADYERIADVGAPRLKSQRVRSQRGPSTRPYASPLTPDEYARRGYVEGDATGVTYRAPDADVLLSDSFAAAHCFRVIASRGDAALLGLAFRPTRVVENRTDVEGTLWLDQRSGELRSLDIRYVGLAEVSGSAGAGARIDFLKLKTGAWVISRWELTAPRTVKVRRSAGALIGSLGSAAAVAQRTTLGDSVADIWHIGGALMRVSVGDTDIWRGPHAQLSGGVVYASRDSGARGIRIARVGTDYATSTNARGTLAIDDILPGHYDMEVRSPDLGALGLDVPELIPLDLVDSVLALPTVRMLSVREAVARACGLSDTLVAIQGAVRDTSGLPVPGALVVARWINRVTIAGDRALFARTASSETTSRADGSYRLCGIPPDRDIRIVAVRQTTRSAIVTTSVGPSPGIATMDLVVNHPALANSEEMHAFRTDTLSISTQDGRQTPTSAVSDCRAGSADQASSCARFVARGCAAEWTYSDSTLARAHGVFRRNLSEELMLGSCVKQRISMRVPSPGHP